MAMQEMTDLEQQPVFGRSLDATTNLEAQRVRRMLQRRLFDKIKNYERIAARLEMRGEKDAAGVLNKAADQLRAITASPA